MATAGPVTITCPACRQPIELPTRITLQADIEQPTATLAVDLTPASDHALTHVPTEAP